MKDTAAGVESKARFMWRLAKREPKGADERGRDDAGRAAEGRALRKPRARRLIVESNAEKLQVLSDGIGSASAL